MNNGHVASNSTFTFPASVTTDGQAHTYTAGSWGEGASGSQGKGGYTVWGFRQRAVAKIQDGTIVEVICSHIKDTYDKYIPGGALQPIYDWSDNMYGHELSPYGAGYRMNFGVTPCNWKEAPYGVYGIHGIGRCSDGCTTIHFGNGSPDPAEGESHDTTLYKVRAYRGKNYLVNYNSNKPLAALFETLTGSMTDEFFELNKTYTLQKNTYNLSNWIFLGWNTKRDGSGTSYTDEQVVKNIGKAGDTITLYAQWKSTMDPNKIKYINPNNPILYAQWEPITYTVKVHPNEVPADATNIIKNIRTTIDYTWDNNGKFYFKLYTYDKDKLDSPDTFYYLKGWHPHLDYMYTKGGVNGEASGTKYKIGETNLTSTQDIVIDLYPYWEKNTYYIKYSGNNTDRNIYNDLTTEYTGTTPDTVCKYDTDVTIGDNKFSKYGYHFKEWNTKSDGSGTTYHPGDYLKKPNFTDVDGGSITFYAIWEPDYFDIEFKQDYGTIIDWDDTYEEYTMSIRFDSITDVYLPLTAKSGYKFLGWAKLKQTIDESINKTPLMNEFWEKGNYKLSVSCNKSRKLESDIHFNPKTETLEMWAWYNRTPIFVDIYDGLFFEGQNINYYDLLELVAAFDYEDDYYNTVLQTIYDLPEINKDDIYFEIQVDEDNDFEVDRGPTGQAPGYVLDTEHWEDLGDGRYKRKEDGKIFYTIESKMKLKDKIDASSLEVQIKSLEYKVKDGVPSSDLKAISGINWKNESQLKNRWLDTSTSRLDMSGLDINNPESYKDCYGDVIVTYTVTDKGITCGGDLIIDSPITLDYSRTCTIQYNNAPMLYLRNVNQGISQVKGTISKQLVLDAEDCINNPPWWYLVDTENTTGYTPPNGYSYNNLQNSIEEVGIWGIRLNTYLDVDTPIVEIQEFVSEWEEGKKLSDLIALKDNHNVLVGTDVTGAKIYEAILSFNVEYDCTDQFGKKASGSIDSSNYKGGQTVEEVSVPYFSQSREERSVVVYVTNDDKDLAMIPANNIEYIRFIDLNWLSSLPNKSYWNSENYGYLELLDILQTKNSIDETIVPNMYSGTKDKLKINIKDYS